MVNAVRYTPEGGLVELGAEVEGVEVKIFVKNTGVGIPPERVPHIFERFYRGNESRADPPGERHAGLGLAIVEQLALAMHGRVAVASAVGRGTTFTLTFRVAGSSQVV